MKCEFCKEKFKITEMRLYLSHLWEVHWAVNNAEQLRIMHEINRVENIPK